ncbi:hypothetical protein [Psychrobacillus sp. FSL K6-2843]|uniref:hypothetical protein n=1 Tax=Psychrobacillus sp. FSL K6-2843 TaxID=2921549 RepID=UPI00315A934A
MRKAYLFLFTLFVLITACQGQDPKVITLKDVIGSLENQHLTLEEPKERIGNIFGNIFGNKLNGIKPNIYLLDNKPFLIYIYPSEEDRKKGLKEFKKETENMNVVSYNLYEFHNGLIFYVYQTDLNESIEEGLQKALSDLEKYR